MTRHFTGEVHAERARIVAIIRDHAETWEAAAKAAGLPERKRSDWIVMAMGARTILHSIQGDDMTERHGLYAEIDRLKAERDAAKARLGLIREAFAAGYARGMEHPDREPFDQAEVAAWEDEAPTFGDGRDPSNSQAARDVLAERARQVSAEGWTPNHDDGHSDGSMSAAAAAYAFSAYLGTTYRACAADPLGFWPWDAEWWKPSHPRRDLVKAGALILAEIERLDRAALASAEDQNDG